MSIDQTTSVRARSVAATARWAFLAGLPGLAITAAAAWGSSSLALRADLVLTALDLAALGAAWALTACPRRAACLRGEQAVALLVALCMMGSLVTVSVLATLRLAGTPGVVEGPGLWLGLGLNLASGAVNAWLLVRWLGQLRNQPGALVRSQVRLFADKLSSNALMAVSLAAVLLLGPGEAAARVDALGSLALALASAWWTLPALASALRDPVGAGGRRTQPA